MKISLASLLVEIVLCYNDPCPFPMRIVLLFFSFVEQVEEVTFVADVAVVVCLLSVR